MNGIYFDNAATTAPTPQIIERAAAFMGDFYGNPASGHAFGIAAARELKRAKEVLAELLRVQPDEIIMTSGGTEANNLAILGTVMSRKRTQDHVILGKTEHPSVLSLAELLTNEGFTVTYAELDQDGKVDGESLFNGVTEKTALVSIMHVNNETGMINNIDGLARLVKKKNANTVFHSDGVQGFCKERLSLSNIDLYSMSGHKVHCIKGVGALYKRKQVRIRPLLHGGGQQQDIRPGTENTLGTVLMAEAAQDMFSSMADNRRSVKVVKDILATAAQMIPDVYINGSIDGDSPYILNMSIMGVRGEVLMNALSAKAVYVSTGAACKTAGGRGGKSAGYKVLEIMGYSKQRADAALRFSFSHLNTTEQAHEALEILRETVAQLRRTM